MHTTRAIFTGRWRLLCYDSRQHDGRDYFIRGLSGICCANNYI